MAAQDMDQDIGQITIQGVKSGSHGLVRESMIDACLRELQQSRGRLCLRFASAEGGHFVHPSSSQGFEAIYAGPHGPENRAANIDIENINRLFDMSEYIEFVDAEESPHRTPHPNK